MRSFVIGIFYLLISVCLWLADTCLLSFYVELDFGAAFFAAVPAGRLALRIFICGCILILGCMKIAQYRHNCGYDHVEYEVRRAEDLYFGSAESRIKNERVLYHCMNLASAFNMTYADRDALRILCYSYDIGKVGVNSDTLHKANRRNAAEQLDYDNHTLYGAEIAAAFEETRAAAPLILYHHEYYNGGGIHGIKGEDIPLACRIFSVVWAYDSMINPTQRTRRTKVCADALQELRYYEGTAFDPVVVETFINLMGKRTMRAGLGSHEYAGNAINN